MRKGQICFRKQQKLGLVGESMECNGTLGGSGTLKRWFSVRDNSSTASNSKSKPVLFYLQLSNAAILLDCATDAKAAKSSPKMESTSEIWNIIMVDEMFKCSLTITDVR